MDDLELKTAIARPGGLFDPARIPWVVAAGAAVYVYTHARPPTDLDVLVPPELDLDYLRLRIARMRAGERAAAVLANWGWAR